MNQPELERERGEFEKWALEERFVPEVIKMSDPHIWQSWKASQQSTLRRVRAVIEEYRVISSARIVRFDILVAAIEREFGGVGGKVDGEEK